MSSLTTSERFGEEEDYESQSYSIKSQNPFVITKLLKQRSKSIADEQEPEYTPTFNSFYIEADISEIFFEELIIRRQNLKESPESLEKKQKKEMKLQIKTICDEVLQRHVDTKNIPKTIGNHFQNYASKLPQKPPRLAAFCAKKRQGKQATYGLEDFRTLFLCPIAVGIFRYYIKNGLFLDLLHSNRKRCPEEYINFIEQYLAATYNPRRFRSNKNR